MDRPRRNDKLGVNKTGKNIKKSSLHQPNFSNGIVSSRPQARPQYIRNNDFRSIVQQLKGSSSRESLLPLPQNPLKSENTQFQKISQAAVTQLKQAHVPSPPVLAPPTHDVAARSPMQPLVHGSQPMLGHGDQVWSNAAESSVSVHIRDLQSSPSGNQMQPSPEYQRQPQMQGQAQLHPPLFNGSASSVPILPTPRFNGPPQQMYTNSLPSPRFNGRGILPSPTSQYLLQSPTTYRDLVSPRSPYPLLSPGVGYPLPPSKPRSFTSSKEPGILGPGIIPRLPASPGIVFPSSPSGVFPNL